MDGTRSMGLTVRDANTTSPSLEDNIAAIREATPAEIFSYATTGPEPRECSTEQMGLGPPTLEMNQSPT